MLHSQLRRQTRYRTIQSDEVADVIDLGAPRVVRPAKRRRAAPAPCTHCPYVPNPRLYPGPQKSAQAKNHCVRRKNLFRKPVPNSRLYRPAPAPPPRPPPPPAVPRTKWLPLPPAQSLETASQAALRLSLSLGPKERKPRPPTPQASPRSKRSAAKKFARASSPRRRNGSKRSTRSSVLKSKVSSRIKTALASAPYVNALPAAGDGHTQRLSRFSRYLPVSRHFSDRDTLHGGSTPAIGRPAPLVTPTAAMDATQRHSASPEDCSDGNDSLSAPSEFLAEFLSAIMQRQYAEALKYCRLILQYEPHNATARGFYPLLQQKLAQHSPREARAAPAPPREPRHHARSRACRSPESGGGSSGESSPTSQQPGLLPHEVMELETDSLSCSGSPVSGRGSAASSPEPEPEPGSVSSQSSLELDSSRSLSLSRRTDRTDRTDSLSASGTWDSAGSTRDDNGNPAPPPSHNTCCDAENNSHTAAAAPRSPPRTRPLTLQSEQSSESLRRLRAQFACSIK